MNEIPLQIDLFTGERVDTRTAAQKKAATLGKPEQMGMFSQRELAQFGVRANPQMSLSEHTRLVLISEDPRTPEEIERDRERQAQSLTRPLFEDIKRPDPVAPVPPTPVDLIYSPSGLTEAAIPEDEIANTDDVPGCPPLPSKLTIYRQLVELAYERSATLSASKPILLSQRIAASVLSCQARLAGLTAEEIQITETIGDYRAKAQKRKMKLPSNCVSTFRATKFPEMGIVWKWTPERWPEMSVI
jgi:hypothetical protein